MILQALVKEYENLAENNLVPKRGWCQAKVSYAIDLNPNGKIKEIYPLKTEQTSGKKKVFLPVAKSVPEMVTASEAHVPVDGERVEDSSRGGFFGVYGGASRDSSGLSGYAGDALCLFGRKCCRIGNRVCVVYEKVFQITFGDKVI